MTGSPGFPTDGRHAPVAVDDTSAATTVRTSDRQALRHGTGEANRSEVTRISRPEDRGLRATFADPAQDAAADNGATRPPSLSAKADDESGEERKHHEDERSCFGNRRCARRVAVAAARNISGADGRRQACRRTHVRRAFAAGRAATIARDTDLADVPSGRRYHGGVAGLRVPGREAQIGIWAIADGHHCTLEDAGSDRCDIAVDPSATDSAVLLTRLFGIDDGR